MLNHRSTSVHSRPALSRARQVRLRVLLPAVLPYLLAVAGLILMMSSVGWD